MEVKIVLTPEEEATASRHGHQLFKNEASKMDMHGLRAGRLAVMVAGSRGRIAFHRYLGIPFPEDDFDYFRGANCGRIFKVRAAQHFHYGLLYNDGDAAELVYVLVTSEGPGHPAYIRGWRYGWECPIFGERKGRKGAWIVPSRLLNPIATLPRDPMQDPARVRKAA